VTSRTNGPYIVALALAVSIGVALNVFSVAVLWDAIQNSTEAGVSENATQILTGWGGGIVGIIGAVVGYNAGANTTRNEFERNIP
jgi:hypothetical protein